MAKIDYSIQLRRPSSFDKATFLPTNKFTLALIMNITNYRNILSTKRMYPSFSFFNKFCSI